MTKRPSRADIEEMAEEVFGLAQLVATARARLSKGTAGLTEPEFFALDALAKDQTLTVGEIQKRIGVLPAQMSRILRSLENREDGESLLECRINHEDRRRIDVTLTPAGKAAHKRYRDGRLSFLIDLLTNLDDSDRVVFMNIVRRFRERTLERVTGA